MAIGWPRNCVYKACREHKGVMHVVGHEILGVVGDRLAQELCAHNGFREHMGMMRVVGHGILGVAGMGWPRNCVGHVQ